MSQSHTDLQQKAEALERRVADTGDFVERRWRQIEARDARRHSTEAQNQILASERIRFEREIEQQRTLTRLYLVRKWIVLTLMLVALLISAALVLVAGFFLVLGSHTAALVSALGAFLAFLATLAHEAVMTSRDQRSALRDRPDADDGDGPPPPGDQ